MAPSGSAERHARCLSWHAVELPRVRRLGSADTIPGHVHGPTFFRGWNHERAPSSRRLSPPEAQTLPRVRGREVAVAAAVAEVKQIAAGADGPGRLREAGAEPGVGVLPPGGLKNLDPKLTVVRKVCEGSSPDQHMPSANTCFHFLKLPEYSSEARLAAQLRVALQHGMDGFFFN